MTTPSRYTFSPCQLGQHDGCSAAYINGAGSCAAECDCGCHRRPASPAAARLLASVAGGGEREYLLTALRAARELPEEPRYAITNQALRRLAALPRWHETPALV